MSEHQLCEKLEKLAKTKKEELPKSIKNPATGRMISTSGKTFLTLMNACTNGCGPGKDACDKLKKNPKVNPLTGRTLKKNSAVRKLISRGCESCEANLRRATASRHRAAAHKIESILKKHAAAKGRQKLEQALSQKAALMRATKKQAQSQKEARHKAAAQKIESVLKKHAAEKGRQKLKQAISQKVAESRSKKDAERHIAAAQKLESIFRKHAAEKGRQRLNQVLKQKVRRMRATKRKQHTLEEVRKRTAAETRDRSATLNAKKGTVDLEAEEVEYILNQNLFDGNTPENAVPYVIDMTQGGGIYQIRQHFDRSGKSAVVYNNGHFVAVQMYIDENGLYTINYYEPFDHPFNSFKNVFRAALETLNDGEVTGHLHSYALKWQKRAGPCGAYAAIAVHALSEGYDLRKVAVRAELAPPTDRIRGYYAWLSQNLERLKR